MIRFCTNCGAKITDDNQKFCNECGNQLTKIEHTPKPIKKESLTKDKKSSSALKTGKKIFLVLAVLLIAILGFILLSPSDENDLAKDENLSENESIENSEDVINTEDKDDLSSSEKNVDNKDANTSNTPNEKKEYNKFYSVDLTCTDYNFDGEKIDQFINKKSSDIIFFEKDMYDKNILNFSSSGFNQKMYVKTFNNQTLNAEYVSENVESFFKGQVVNNGNVFIKGSIQYTDYVSSLSVSYDVLVYKHKSLSLDDLSGIYKISPRDVWLHKEPLDKKLMDFLINQQEKYLNTYFKLTFEKNNKKLFIEPQNDFNRAAEYVLDFEKNEGYLKHTSTPFWVGEYLEITPVYHPEKDMFYTLLKHKSKDDGFIYQSLEGYEKSLSKNNDKNTDDSKEEVSSNLDNSSWYGNEKLPFFIIFPSSELKVPKNNNYDFPFENEAINFETQNFLFTNTIELMPFALPFEKEKNSFTINASLYWDLETVSSDFTNYYVKDNNGNIYHFDSHFSKPKKMDKLPKVMLAANYKCSGKLIENETLEYNINVEFYEEGTDPDNPEASYAEEFKKKINLNKK